MPIYEYQCLHPQKGCSLCRDVFEALQGLQEPALIKCPECGKPVRRLISRCRTSVKEHAGQTAPVEKQIKDYESAGRWSHAAELADKHSQKTKDKNLKTRALDNYKKAGYDAKLLDKHAK